MSESRQRIGTSHLVLNLKTLSDNPYIITDTVKFGIPVKLI